MSSFSDNYRASSDFLVSPGGLVFLFGKICVVATIYFAAQSSHIYSLVRNQKIPPLEDDSSSSSHINTPKIPLEGYSVITSRNIFGGTKQDRSQPQVVKTQQTELKLRLVGTNVSEGGSIYALIEDQSKQQQDVFSINDMVFDKAKLIDVARDNAKVEFNGTIVTLQLDEPGRGGSSGEITASDDGTEFSVPEQELASALANIPQLLSQARAVPFFRDGQNIGLRLFAITRGSLYEKLGLRNGDVLKTVNDMPMTDPAKALELFQQLKTERSIKLILERAGEEKNLHYSIG